MNETQDYYPPHADESAAEHPQLVEAVRAYQAALEEGHRPSKRDFISRYPEIAVELAECLDGLEFLHSAAPRLQARGAAEAAAPPPPPDGTLGDFRLLREIGRGGMGVVYEAEQISLGRRVALKVLPLAATLDARQLQRFENEARAAAHLQHANIVPVFAVGCERGVHYYAMQLIEGRTLAAVIDDLRQKPLPGAPAADTAAGLASVTQRSVGSQAFFRAAAALAAQAAEALEYAHQMGVVHRDVKPANLLLDRRGNLWVTDFGLARFQPCPALTVPGDLVGTLRYMSPEQAAGKPVIDPRSDVYSLGATLYELLTQQPAFTGRDRQECLRQVLDEEPAPPRRLNKALPAELETIVLKAMAKHPEERYATAKELADDLRRFLDDRPIRARRPGLRERTAKWAWRHRRVVAGAVAGLVAAVLVLATTTWRVARAEADARGANHALKDANDALKQEKAALQKEKARTAAALEQEVLQRDRAEANYQSARGVLDYLTRLMKELDDKPQLQQLRRRLLTELKDYYQEFIDRHGDDPSIKLELSAAWFQVADLLAEIGEPAAALAAYEKGHECQRGPGGPRSPPHFPGPGGPPHGLAPVFLLAQDLVQKDLKLSPEQVKKVKAIVGDRPKPPPPRDSSAAAEKAKALAGVLTPGQAERLKQIIRQSRGPHALLDAETAAALGLSESQQKDIHAALTKPKPGPPRRDPPNSGGKGKRPGGGPGGPGKGGKRPPPPDWKQAHEQALRVLEPEQRARWKQLLGEPSQGALRPAPPPPRPPRDR